MTQAKPAATEILASLESGRDAIGSVFWLFNHCSFHGSPELAGHLLKATRHLTAIAEITDKQIEALKLEMEKSHGRPGEGVQDVSTAERPRRRVVSPDLFASGKKGKPRGKGKGKSAGRASE
jgi:hypothetical protein